MKYTSATFLLLFLCVPTIFPQDIKSTQATEKQQVIIDSVTQQSTTTSKTITSTLKSKDISCPKHDTYNGQIRLSKNSLVPQDQTVELCSHEDRGTCGNACCTLQAVALPGCDSLCAVNQLKDILLLEQGVTVKNITDLKQLNVGHFRHDTVEYLLAASRIAEDGREQNILFSVGGSDLNTNQALIKGFSESKRIGSYRDYGQNYRNLHEIFRNMEEDTTMVILHGCGRNGLIKEQGATVLLIGAGTVGLVVGGVIVAILGLLSGGASSSKRRRRRRGGVN